MNILKNNSSIEIIKLISNNMFYISSLPSDADYNSIYSKFDYLEKKIKLNLNFEYFYNCPGLLKDNLSNGKLQNTKGRLNKETMIQERLFWFFEPEKILKDLNKDKMWSRAKKFFERNNILDQHDGALLALIYLAVYDNQVREIKKWLKMIDIWNHVLENEQIAQKIISAEKNVDRFKSSAIEVFSNIIKYSLYDIAINSIKFNYINTLDHVVFILKEYNIKNEYTFIEKFINKIFNRINETISDETEELFSNRNKIRRKDTNTYSDFKFNKSLCKKAYNKYLEIIEPLLVVSFCHLGKKDYKLKLIREEVLELLHSLAIDFTWAKKREKSKQILNKASRIYYETPIKFKIKELNNELGEIYVSKNKKKVFPYKIKKFIIYNPFRFLDISADSNSQEIQRAIKRLEIKLEYNFSSALSWDLNFLPKLHLEKSTLDLIKGMIADSKDISKARLFWFINRENVLMKMNNDEILKTAFYWYQNSSSLVEKHDSIFLSLLYLFIQDKNFELIEQWGKSLYLWVKLNNELNFEDKFNKINSKDELNIISELDLDKLIFDFIWELFKFRDDSLMINFFDNILEHYNKSPDYESNNNAITKVKAIMFSLLTKQIRIEIKNINSDIFIKQFEEIVLPKNKKILLLNEQYSLSSKNINNIVSEELTYYAINNFPYKSKDSLNILYKARSINPDEETIKNIDELIKTIKPEKERADSSNKKNNNKTNSSTNKVKPQEKNLNLVFISFIVFFIIYIIGLFF